MSKIEIEFGADFKSYYKEFSEALKKSHTGIDKIQDTFKKIAGASIMGYGIKQLFQIGAEAMKSAAELDVLRSSFRGTASDVELMRKATAGTVNEASLLKMSNQATELGLAMKTQAILMSMAEDQTDKFGGTVEDNFMGFIKASEGVEKGLFKLGIQKEKYKDILQSIVSGAGAKNIEQLDAESQKQARLEALVRASGLTLDDVRKKTKDGADVIESYAVSWGKLELGIGKILNSPKFVKFLGLLSKAAEGWAILLGGASGGSQDGQRERQLGYYESIKDFSKEQLAAEEARLNTIKEQNKSMAGKGTGFVDNPQDITNAKIAIQVANEQLKVLKERARWAEIAKANNESKTLKLDTGKSKEAELIQSDALIKKELARIDVELKGNVSARERNDLLEKRLKLENELLDFDRAMNMTDAAKKANLGVLGVSSIPIDKNNFNDKFFTSKTQSENMPNVDSSLMEIDDTWKQIGETAADATNMMASGLSRALVRAENLGDALKDVGSSFLESGLTMLFTIGMKAGLTALGLPAFLFANGGVIAEPVVGMGLNSRKSYMFGEAGNEIVIPASRYASGGGGMVTQKLIIETTPLTGDMRTLQAGFNARQSLDDQYR